MLKKTNTRTHLGTPVFEEGNAVLSPTLIPINANFLAARSDTAGEITNGT